MCVPPPPPKKKKKKKKTEQVPYAYVFIYRQLIESQKGVIADQRRSVENQKGAIAIDFVQR